MWKGSKTFSATSMSRVITRRVDRHLSSVLQPRGMAVPGSNSSAKTTFLARLESRGVALRRALRPPASSRGAPSSKVVIFCRNPVRRIDGRRMCVLLSNAAFAIIVISAHSASFTLVENEDQLLTEETNDVSWKVDRNGFMTLLRRCVH